MQPPARPRRLFISGGSDLSPNAVRLWTCLGRLLAQEDDLVAITGGLQARLDQPSAITADFAGIQGFQSGLRTRGLSPDERIETILPNPARDRGAVRFRYGKVLGGEQWHANPQARRFAMVYSADVVVAIEGERGTQSVLDVALALDRPILPLPFRGKSRGKACQKAWSDCREEIQKWFRLEDAEMESLKRVNLDRLSPSGVRALAERVKKCLLRGFTRACFVIMPFHRRFDSVFRRAIEPALAAHGLTAVRTDRTLPAGDILEAIREGLRHCALAVADTTGDNPNVSYEVGMAHQMGRTTILLRRASRDGSMPPLPFDLQNERVFLYTKHFEKLQEQLRAAIALILAPRGAPLGGVPPIPRATESAGTPDAPPRRPPLKRPAPGGTTRRRGRPGRRAG